MSTNVNYNSLMAIPSDYDNNDGTLDMAINLIPENAALKPVQRPKNVFELELKPKEVVVGMHKVNNQTNIITYSVNDNNTISVYWNNMSDGTFQSRSEIEIVDECSINDCEIIGNTIILATSKGMRYYLWSVDKYIPLGERPPFVPISFGMVSKGSLLPFERYIWVDPKTLPNSQSFGGNHPEKELADATTSFYAVFNRLVREEITAKGCFFQPFFVRYAYKLYDGSYWWCSAPVLMMPSVTIPKVQITNGPNDNSSPFSDSNLQTSFADVLKFDLQYRIMSSSDDIKKWSDLLQGIDVFVSLPIYTYDASKNFGGLVASRYQSLLTKCPFYDEETVAIDTRDRPTTGVKSRVLLGCYADIWSQDFKQWTVDPYNINPNETNKGNVWVWNIQPKDDFIDEIKGQQSFYKFASIELKDIKGQDAFVAFKNEQLYDKDLANLASRPVLKDDYLSFSSIAGNCLYAMNGRLNIGGADIIPSEPHPINSVCHPSGNFQSTDTMPTQNVRFKVWIKSNGQIGVAEHNASQMADKWNLTEDNFPYWIYYPHPGAFRMEISVGNVSKIVSLVQHPFLNGAYFMKTSVKAPKNERLPVVDNAVISFTNSAKVYTSEINNPFIFFPDKINTIGSGNGIIKALASANKPLSQGQFGEFPIYAFTTEGVWALTISNSGAIASKQPIVRDVALAKESILQLDDSVLFATDKGIMAIQGAGTENITYPVLADGEFDITLLPKFDKVIELFNGYSQKKSVPYNLAVKDLANIDSYSYLCGCRMVYDYKNARVIIFNPNNKVALVYSLKSKMWGQMYSDFEYPVNSYPDALAVTASGKIVNFSEPLKADESIAIALMTRPFALGDSDVFKTIQTIIQRGRFDKDKVKQILYGSNDLYNWQIVWSSDNAYMSGFSGEPYKSFRIAVIGELDLGDALSRFSVDYRQKQTNKLR